MRWPLMFLTMIPALAACSPAGSTPPTASEARDGSAPAADLTNSGDHPETPLAQAPFTLQDIARFNEPWAMAFWPGLPLLFVTEKAGTVKFIDLPSGRVGTVTGLPSVAYGGQGGLGDIAFAPTPVDSVARSRTIWLSWAEEGTGNTRGAVVGRGTLTCAEADACAITGMTVIWRQSPKVSGRGHYGHRLAFSPDGKTLFISSGERQKMTPAQDPASDLGKIIALDLATNKARHVTLGHRNPLGIAFDGDGRLWETEMGPAGGDELNLIESGNYGWPKASNGSHYDGAAIPDHTAGDGFVAPKLWWTPSISPSSLMIYRGSAWPQWTGDAFIGALSGESLIRVDLNGTQATKAERWSMGERIRAVQQDDQGAIWLLTDGDGGRLVKLVPKAR